MKTNLLRSWIPAVGLALAATALLIGDPLREAQPTDDFILREEMIPMRDGVKLYTLTLTPKNASGPLPMLLQRTPYNVASRVPYRHHTTLQAVLGPRHAEVPAGDYIWVFQDIRGRFKSEGDYIALRPLRGRFNLTQTDHVTDTWDTIEWLTKNVAGNNGRLGIYGVSYEGWLSLLALLDPHPALKVAVPINPVADMWMGDDWFHNGAFRVGFTHQFLYRMETGTTTQPPFPYDHYDLYSWWLREGSAASAGRHFDQRHKLWAEILAHPSYDEVWQEAAVDRLLAASRARPVPTLHIHGLFDQEDIYGAPSAYAAMEPRDTTNRQNYFIAGPWFHGQTSYAGDKLGNLLWDENTAKHWRADVLAPFLAHYLKDGPPHGVAPAQVFNTGTRHWEKFDIWPRPAGVSQRNLYLQENGGIGWNPPTAGEAADAYVSDPAKPVPYQLRPVRAIFNNVSSGDDPARNQWRTWLVADQRFSDGRPDVLTYVSGPLADPVTVRGAVTAKLFAETSGTDADWVVKLIDVFPDQDAAEPDMSGYEFMISGDILRGRYREDPSVPKAIVSGQPLEYTIRLPQVNHTFKRGHRLMVQVQSSWFPLYDRNPQTFVPNIMEAKPQDYQKATQRIHRSAAHPTHLVLTVSDAP